MFNRRVDRFHNVSMGDAPEKELKQLLWENEKAAQKEAKAAKREAAEAKRALQRQRRREYLAALSHKDEEIKIAACFEHGKYVKEAAARDAVYGVSSPAEVIRTGNAYNSALKEYWVARKAVTEAAAEVSALTLKHQPDLISMIKNAGFPTNVTGKLLELNVVTTFTSSDVETILMSVPGVGRRRSAKLLELFRETKKAAELAESKDKALRHAKQDLQKAVEVQNKIAARVENLQRALQKIAYGDPMRPDASTEEVALLAKAMLERHEKFNLKPEKTTKVDLWSYGQRVVKPIDLFGETIVNYMKTVHDATENDNNRNWALAELEDAVAKLADSTFTTFASKLEIRRMRQSQLAEFFGAEPDELTENMVVFDHDLGGMLVPSDTSCFVPRKLGKIEYNGKQRIEKVFRDLINLIVGKGFVLVFDGNKVPKKYDVVVSSSSGLKQGVIQCGEHKAYLECFDALTCGLMGNLPHTNGSELFKVDALFSTPSKVFEYGPDPDHLKKIHVRDIIMCEDQQLSFRIPADEGWLKYGKSGNNISITINNGDGKKTIRIPVEIHNGEIAIHKVDGFDGLMLANIDYDIPAFQARLGGMKMLMINVYGLVNAIIEAKPEKYGHLCGKTLTRMDVDGVEQEWTEGRCLATMSTWKMKNWFRKNWSQFVRNCEQLALKYADYDCVRIVAQADAEEEMETNRQTARQLLQQILSMSGEDLEKMLKNPTEKAAKRLTFIGAFEEFAGINKADNKLSPLNHVFRLCPELAAAPEIADYAVLRAFDSLADLAAGHAPTEEATLFMAQDPSAMLEIMLLGANPEDPDLGMLKANEFSCPSIDDGREGALIRFPANGINAVRVMTNCYQPMFAVCGNVIIINIHDPWIVDNDGDCDGDHAAAFLWKRLVNAVKRTREWLKANGMLHTVLFDHGSSAAKGEPTKEFMRAGKVEAIVNGQLFNFVGRFANAALWAWSRMSDCVYHGLYEEAMTWYYTGHLFNVASILCIDWCKTGVPENGTPNRAIFDAAFEILEARGDFLNGHAFGRMPWAQAFRDHTPITSFVNNLVAEEKESASGYVYTKHRYAMPGDGTVDRLAMTVMNLAGVDISWSGEIENPEKLIFDDMNRLFDLAAIGTNGPCGPLDCEIRPANVKLDVALLQHINPDRLDKKKVNTSDDVAFIRDVDAGKPVNLKNTVQFLWHAINILERRFARMMEDKAGNGMIVEDTRALFYAAARSILLGFAGQQEWVGKSGKTVSDAARQREMVIDWCLLYAFGNHTREEMEARAEVSITEERRLAAQKAWFILNVFAPDILSRLEERNRIPEDERLADTEILELDKADSFNNTRRMAEEDLIPPAMVDAAEEMAEDIFDAEELDINRLFAEAAELNLD